MFNFVLLMTIVLVLTVVCTAAYAEFGTYEVNEEKCIYAFTQNMTPILTVPNGSTLIIKTKDCYSNQLLNPGDIVEEIGWSNINPATGPIFVEGAEPGDTLEVEIEKIEVGSQGVMMVDKSFGLLNDRFDGMLFRIFQIKDEKVIFDDRLSIPIRPMIGVIGVAPKSGLSFNTGTPNSHGGNMDTNLIAAGTALYLPVSEKGAMLAVGDVHAAMGDGEICGTGVETAAVITLKVSVRKGLKLNNPVLDNGEVVITIASAATFDGAAVVAVADMADILTDRIPLDMEHINYLMSATGNLQISQVVDPLMTVRFSMDKDILSVYDFKL